MWYMANVATAVRRPPVRWWSRVVALTPLVPLVGAIWWVDTFNPTDGAADPTTWCAWHALTGINGPTCGGTRAFYDLVHGDVVGAAQNHLPFVMAAPVLLYWWATWVAAATFGVRLPRPRLNRWVVIGFGIFAMVFTTVLRNLPIEPFAWFDIPNMTHRVV